MILVPAATAANAEEYRYMASGASVPGFAVVDATTGLGCAEERSAPVGRLCGLPVAPGETLRVTVRDDVNGAVPFSLRLPDDSALIAAELCGEPVEGAGSATIVVPEGCSGLDIEIGSGGRLGTIVVERL